MGLFDFFKLKRRADLENPRYFLCLGAGVHQIPLIQAARSQGWKVIAVDHNLKAPGLKMADLQVQCSLDDPDKIVQTILENFGPDIIGAVGGRSFGALNRNLSLVAEAFQLPCTPSRSINQFMHKKHYKLRLARAGVRIPRIYSWGKRADQERLLNAPLPLLYRPAVGHGKKGIGLIHENDRRVAFLQKHQEDDDSILVEEFLTGREFTILGMVVRGEFRPILITEKERSSRPPLYAELAHKYPAWLEPEKESEMVDMMQKIATEMEIHSAPLLGEFILGNSRRVKQDRLYLVEAAPEVGGEFLADVMVPALKQVNYFQELIKLQAGLEVSHALFSNDLKDSAIIRYIPPGEGILQSIEFPRRLKSMKEHLFSSNLKEPGAKINTRGGNLNRLGVFALKGGTDMRAALDELSQEIANETVVSYR